MTTATMTKINAALIVLLWSSTLPSTDAFLSISSARSQGLPGSVSSSARFSKAKVSKVSSTASTSAPTLPGVTEFESWFSSKISNDDKENTNNTMDKVRHGQFRNGRGLEYIAKGRLDPETPVIELPKELVLQSTMVEDKESLETVADDWDSVLATQLLHECQKGAESEIYGYCSLLARGVDFNTASPCPPSTAPDCIRNWTSQQKDILQQSKRGARLLRISDTQMEEWEAKYNALPTGSSDQKTFTMDQFVWAMEAVNSRAFKGDFGGEDLVKKLSKSLIPFAAAAFGLNLVATGSGPFASDERITLVLLVLSCAPVLLNFVSENFGDKSMDAVLLPFIDSANHDVRARSTIEFNPLKGVFAVSAEEKSCIRSASLDSGKKQFYISYGEKLDTELLLNYGFLNDFEMDEDESDDERRRRLAETFNARAV